MQMRIGYMPEHGGIGIWLFDRRDENMWIVKPIQFQLEKSVPGEYNPPTFIVAMEQANIGLLRQDVEVLTGKTITVNKELVRIYEVLGEMRHFLRKVFTLDTEEIVEGKGAEILAAVRKFMQTLNRQEAEYKKAIEDGATSIVLPPSVEKTGRFRLLCKCTEGLAEIPVPVEVDLNFVHTVYKCEGCDRVYAMKIEQPKDGEEDEHDDIK